MIPQPSRIDTQEFPSTTASIITVRPHMLFATLIEEVLHVHKSIQVRECNSVFRPVKELLDAGAELLESRIVEDPEMLLGHAEVSRWRLAFPVTTKAVDALHLR